MSNWSIHMFLDMKRTTFADVFVGINLKTLIPLWIRWNNWLFSGRNQMALSQLLLDRTKWKIRDQEHSGYDRIYLDWSLGKNHRFFPNLARNWIDEETKFDLFQAPNSPRSRTIPWVREKKHVWVNRTWNPWKSSVWLRLTSSKRVLQVEHCPISQLMEPPLKTNFSYQDEWKGEILSCQSAVWHYLIVRRSRAFILVD